MQFTVMCDGGQTSCSPSRLLHLLHTAERHCSENNKTLNLNIDASDAFRYTNIPDFTNLTKKFHPEMYSYLFHMSHHICGRSTNLRFRH
jgi:hypothetical protein